MQATPQTLEVAEVPQTLEVAEVPLMRRWRAVMWLGVIIVALALVATLGGLFWPGSGESSSFTTVRGTTADLYGHGLYRYDTVFSAAGNRGTDAVTLVLGIPLLMVSLLLYRRRSVRGGLLLTGVVTYFLYVHASLSLGAAFNSLFLAYVALFSAGFYALVLLLRSIDLSRLPERAAARLPRRGPATFLIVAGAVTLLVWLSPLVPALLKGESPKHMDSYTTVMTYALDLAVIVPASFIAACLILRRVPLGHLVAFALLGTIVLLGPTIAAQTISRSRAGVSFTPGEAVGPVAGFLAVAVWAVLVMIGILRVVPGGTESGRSRD